MNEIKQKWNKRIKIRQNKTAENEMKERDKVNRTKGIKGRNKQKEKDLRQSSCNGFAQVGYTVNKKKVNER